MNKISETICSIFKSFLIITLGLPICMLFLLASMIMCLAYGCDLCRSIISLLSSVWAESMPGADYHIDVLITGAFFAIGISLVWLSSMLIRCMLKAYRKSFLGKMPIGY